MLRQLRHNGRMEGSVEGVYRNGKIELMEPLAEAEGSRVIVTWWELTARLIFAKEGSMSTALPVCTVG